MSKSYHSATSYTDIEDLKRLDFIVDAVKSLNNPNAKVLDIGCGNGNIARALGSVGFNVLGVDVDQDSINKARELNTFDNVKFDLLDANSFEMDAIFDAIVCSEVLEHLTNPDELVTSIHRILKPGGVFVATVPNGFGPREVLITKPMQWMSRNKIDGPMIAFKRMLGYKATTLQSSNADLTHTQFFTVKSLSNMIAGKGFKLLKFGNADFLERIFPYSWFTRRIKVLQKIDCAVADYLPKALTCGFYTSWTKPKI